MSGDQRLSSAFQECSPSMVRNVCVIAHVDHGKTTLADFLVSANGIISARLAGKLRYMDSREDEQVRGITMKSSAITLYYEPLLLNLIDSPGHVDFCTEVSSAVNLADIAILLVDAVEGVCSQTESLIRQALVRRLDIVLVINKMDRLIVELRMSEAEAHRHLQRLIEFVNACLSKAIQGQLLEEDWHTFEQIESQLHFDPAKGNVLFASALHGFAFALEDFAQMWAKRLAAKQQKEAEDKDNQNDLIQRLKTVLIQHLFSRDHFYSTKNGEICAGAEQRGKRTLFEQFVLEPLWEMHKSALIDKDMDRLRQLASKLALPPLRGKRSDEAFPELMRHWLPLSSAVVRACARCRSAQQAYQRLEDGRLRQLFIDDVPPSTSFSSPSSSLSAPAVDHSRLPGTATSLRQCSPDDAQVLVFAAKSFKATDQQQRQRRVSLCRVMSGTLRAGDQLFVLKSTLSSITAQQQSNNKFAAENLAAMANGTESNQQPKPEESSADGGTFPNSNNNSTTDVEEGNWLPVRLTSLFLLLGRELLPVQTVPCGRICGIEVEEGECWIGGPLLSSRPLSPAETPRLDGAGEQRKFADPLVRVIIKPANNPGPTEFAELRSALRQLAVLDSAVRIVEQRENELMMLTAGEVHMQKCLEDLNALGQTDLVVSEPIVPFLETLLPDPRVSHAKILTDHLTECRLRQFSLRIRLRAVPLAGIDTETHKLVELLEKNGRLIDSFREGINLQQASQVAAFREELTKCACECLPRLKGSWWARRPRGDIQRLFSDGLLAFGPHKARLNLLFNHNNALCSADANAEDECTKCADAIGSERSSCVCVWRANLRSLDQAVVGGFHAAMAQGPLCDEPMQGVGIVLEEWTLEEEEEEEEKCQQKYQKEEDEAKEAAEAHENGTAGNMEKEEAQSSSETQLAGPEGEEDEDLLKRKRRADRMEKLHANSQLHGQLISAIRQTCRAALKKHTGALRLLAAMYECRVQTPEQALGKVQAVLAQKRAKVHSEEVNELSGLFEICAHLPVVESFSFCEQLRKRSSGTASAQLEFAGWEIIDEDPFWEPSTEEEMEEFGKGGAIQQQNQARQYMDAVRRRKGLPTEDVLVVFAEKQRNLKRNK